MQMYLFHLYQLNLVYTNLNINCRLSKLCHAKASGRKTGIQQIKVSYTHVEIRSSLLYGIKIERDRMRVSSE